jgi:plastocyanin
VLGALSTGHKIGLLTVAGIFIAFALISSLLIPRYRPDFPGARKGLFIGATVTLFVAMLLAVEFFAVEQEEASGHEGATTEQTTTQAPGASKVAVTAVDFRFELPSKTVSAGEQTFELENKGKVPHNLFVKGPGVGNKGTKTIQPGEKVDLTVTLKKGHYELYCAVPGHKQLGMDETITAT